jgi:hypothetical protein
LAASRLCKSIPRRAAICDKLFSPTWAVVTDPLFASLASFEAKLGPAALFTGGAIVFSLSFSYRA